MLGHLLLVLLVNINRATAAISLPYFDRILAGELTPTILPLPGDDDAKIIPTPGIYPQLETKSIKGNPYSLFL